MKVYAAMLLAVMLALCSMPSVSESDFDPEAYEAERELWFGSGISDREMTVEEQAVDALLSDMKDRADALYTKSVGYGLVTAGNARAAGSDLYAFCKALPKGGDLHAHDYTVVPMDAFLDVLIDYGGEGVAVCLEKGASFGALYAPGAEPTVDTVPLKAALEDGSVTRERLRGALSIAPGKTPRQAWDLFEPFFGKTAGLSADHALVEQLYRAGLRSCVENGATLVELRVWLEDDEANRELIELIKRAYFAVKADHPEFTVRIIAASGKVEAFTVEHAENNLRSAIRLSREIVDDFDPDAPRPFIIGLDLVNEEDSSRPLAAYADFFLSDEVQDSGLQLFMHCGESLRLDNQAVVDAWLFGTSRLGHGFNLYRYPKLLEALAENDIAVEVCPVSNCLLGYVQDLRLHPAQNYLRSGVPVVLCSDDGLFLEDAPLTEDYFAAILSWDLSLAEVKAIAENAILYSGLSEDEVNELHDAWQAQWDAFIAEWSQAVEWEAA